jgi:hypothetical protein
MESLLRERANELSERLWQAAEQWDALAARNAEDKSGEGRGYLDQINEVLAQMSYINNLIDDIEEEFHE